MCKLLCVSRSGYYQWLNRPPSAREEKHKVLLKTIQNTFADSRQTYGRRRVHRQIVAQGQHCNLKVVGALMTKHSIKPERRRKFRSTTDSKHDLKVDRNLLNRQFQVDTPNSAWVSDITYIDTKEGWLYLAVFIDLYSRQIVGWSARADMTVELVLAAYAEAKTSTGNVPDLVH
jgi:putative transposase